MEANHTLIHLAYGTCNERTNERIKRHDECNT